MLQKFLLMHTTGMPPALFFMITFSMDACKVLIYGKRVGGRSSEVFDIREKRELLVVYTMRIRRKCFKHEECPGVITGAIMKKFIDMCNDNHYNIVAKNIF